MHEHECSIVIKHQLGMRWAVHLIVERVTSVECLTKSVDFVYEDRLTCCCWRICMPCDFSTWWTSSVCEHWTAWRTSSWREKWHLLLGSRPKRRRERERDSSRLSDRIDESPKPTARKWHWECGTLPGHLSILNFKFFWKNDLHVV